MRPLVTSLVTVALLASAVHAGAVPASEETVTLTVTVVDDGGDPVRGAELNGTWDGGSSTAQTANNGKAFLDVPQGADVSIAVDHPDFVRNHPKVVEDAGQEEVTLDVAPKAYLTVRTARTDGAPVSARIIVREPDGTIAVSTTSNSSGLFQSSAIEEGQYSVVAFQTGFFRNRTSLHVSGNSSTTLKLEQGSVTVRVEVRDDHFTPARPVENATVSIEGVGSAKTLGNGETSLQIPVNSEVAVTITKPGYRSTEGQIDVRESAKQVRMNIRRTPALSVTASNERVVVGERASIEVTDEYGAPVADARVLLDGSEVATTDESGKATITIETAGEHRVQVETDRVTSSAIEVEGIVPAGTDRPTASPTETDDGAIVDVPQPGFTTVTALVALLAVIGIARVVRRR